jgi:hypothetical protein
MTEPKKLRPKSRRQLAHQIEELLRVAEEIKDDVKRINAKLDERERESGG